jgi:hypothetical protein
MRLTLAVSLMLTYLEFYAKCAATALICLIFLPPAARGLRERPLPGPSPSLLTSRTPSKRESYKQRQRIESAFGRLKTSDASQPDTTGSPEIFSRLELSF